MQRNLYLPILEYSMKKKFTVLGIAGIFLVIALFLSTKLGTEFIPIMDEGAFDMDVALLPGVSFLKQWKSISLQHKR